MATPCFPPKLRVSGCFFMPVLKNILRPYNNPNKRESWKRYLHWFLIHIQQFMCTLPCFFSWCCTSLKSGHEIWVKEEETKKIKITQSPLYSVTMLNNIEKPCQRWKKGAPQFEYRPANSSFKVCTPSAVHSLTDLSHDNSAGVKLYACRIYFLRHKTVLYSVQKIYQCFIFY